MRNESPFNGHTIYAGIDVHKKSWDVSLYSEHIALKRFNQPSDPKDLCKYLEKNYPGAIYKAVYEAGFCGFELCRQLNSLGVDTIIVNPADVPTTFKEKERKSDAIDSSKLARSLRAGLLTAIHMPSKENLRDRSLLRTRDKLVRDQTRYKNRIKSYLNFMFIRAVEDFDMENENWTKQFMLFLEDVAKDHSTVDFYLVQLKAIQNQIKVITKQLTDLSKDERYAHRYQLLKSIPGVGVLSAMAILLELEDIKRFKTNNDLASYVGITPTRHASGEKDYAGKISYRGNKILKKYLVECSWRVVGADPEMALAYNNYCKRMKSNRAIIRIARKLLNRIKSILDNNRPYQVNHNL